MHDEQIRLAALADACQLLALFLHLPTRDIVTGLLDGTVAADVAQLLAELGVSDSSGVAAGIGAGVDASACADGAAGACIGAGAGAGVSACCGTSAGAAGDIGAGVDARSLLRELRTEYLRLFTHPVHPAVPIYESTFLYWLDPAGKPRPTLFTNQAALDLERLYKATGLIRSPAVNDSADHFATQLEFAAFLLRELIALPEAVRTDGLISPGTQIGVCSQNEPISVLARQTDDASKIWEDFVNLHLSRWMRPFFAAVGHEARHTVYRQIANFGFAVATQISIGVSELNNANVH
jgi:TorA maturation chaperone TorD